MHPLSLHPMHLHRHVYVELANFSKCRLESIWCVDRNATAALMQHTLSLHRKIAAKKFKKLLWWERQGKKRLNRTVCFKKRKTFFCSTMSTVIGMVWCGFTFSLSLCASVCVATDCVFFLFNSWCGISIWNRNQTKRIESNSIQSKTSTTHNKLNVIHISVYQVFYWLGFTIFFRIKLRIYANIVITRSFDYFCCSALFSNSNWSYCFRHRRCLRDVSLAFDCIVGCANLKTARV